MKTPFYKIIACDLDETLLSTDCTICERNKRAIAQALELGVKFVPATGRGYESVRGTLEILNLWQKKDQYVISFNGGAITENENNRVIDIDPLPFDIVRNLYNAGYHKYDLCMHVYTDKEVYVYKPNASELAFLNNRLDFVPLDKDNVEFLKDRYIVKVLFMYEDYNYLSEIGREMAPMLTDCEVSYSSCRYIEFNHRGVDKGRGLLKLAERLGVPREQTIAIGDNINDRAMIQAAGLGVGVANTYAPMRAECDFITEATNNEGGVGEVIEKFILKA